MTDTPHDHRGPSRMLLPAAASIGAGAIHAAAIGVHNEHSQAVLAFTVVAAFQVGWGALALRRLHRLVAAAGVVGHALVVGSWLLAKTTGIGFVGGLGSAEAVQLADGLAAALGVVAVIGAALHLVGRAPTAAPASLAGAGALALAALAVPGMLAAGSHSHEGHAPGEVASGDHGDHHGVQGDHGGDRTELAAASHDDHAAEVEAKPYDPTKPIDLGGMEGVTPTQQAAAENLVSASILYLPQFADPAVAEAAGYHSIGDAIGGSGYEHLVNWHYLDDDKLLDPNHPESLVYRVEDGERTLEAAMFMMGEDDTLDDAPELGGPLTQWHVHDDLCYTDDPVAPKVRGLREPGGKCAPPLVEGKEVPMIHVWIVPNPCGPFAALDGIAAGAIAEGEERLCDHAHGSGH